ncbi:MAG: cytochrome c3 family protein [Anaerolineaceae bacterium]|nr:cytochrome c3 family protein [Anaerolineaceae bacterium]
MRRRLPYFTPASIAFTLLLFFGIGFAVWKAGGLVINPGAVSAKSQAGVVLEGFASHVDFEKQCVLCHQPLTSPQADLCLGCHQSVKRQVNARAGFHGSLPTGRQCAACHREHQGRQFDPTGFALAGFNHTQTRFPLTGKHLQTACAECHSASQYRKSSIECVACHSDPKEHTGVFEAACAACHSTDAWKPASVHGAVFDHAKTAFQLTRHTLDYAHQPISCAGCHRTGVISVDQQATCTSCHTQQDRAFMEKHQSHYGADCLSCHDGVDRMVPFEHASFFPLDGAHEKAACGSCHADQKFTGTPTECTRCHADAKMHAGVFGNQCQACHTTAAWTPAHLWLHTFPLNHGGQGEQTCQTCHTKTYADYTCISCHDHQPDELAASHAPLGIPAADYPKCDVCHPEGKK